MITVFDGQAAPSFFLYKPRIPAADPWVISNIPAPSVHADAFQGSILTV